MNHEYSSEVSLIFFKLGERKSEKRDLEWGEKEAEPD